MENNTSPSPAPHSPKSISNRALVKLQLRDLGLIAPQISDANIAIFEDRKVHDGKLFVSMVPDGNMQMLISQPNLGELNGKPNGELNTKPEPQAEPEPKKWHAKNQLVAVKSHVD
ncbi:Protein of unknown function [Pyronema omphalodes CBS 100304]|uniref:Uncharacterized protein n=1 Tax=Pyronema omphalodes (strain CBS 100304) TaxID=1076935 RepID=U4LKK3_PYROM|nr:Protein of unknown function [Pyronema omphalodes CBS 100304]